MPARPERPRGFLRSALLAPVVFLSSVALVLTINGPASANSAAGIAQNAWLVSDLAAQGYTAMQNIPPSAEVTAWEAAQVATATTATTAADGLDTKPKAGGKLGMVLNTVAVLGGLSFLWPGGSDAPALPTPPPSDVATGSTTCGWTTVPGGTCSWVNVSGKVSNFLFPKPPNDLRYYVARASAPTTRYGAPLGSAEVGLNMDGTGQAVEWIIFGPTTTPATAPEAGRAWVPSSPTTPVANPKPGGTTTDPALLPRYIDSQINCKSASGATQTLSRRDGPFTFDPAQPFTMPEVPDMVCPEGTWLKSGGRSLHTEGTEVTQDVPLQDPYEAPDWVGEQAGAFPECFPIGATVCQLKLYKKPVGTTSPEYDCHAFPLGSANPCLDWRTDPNKRDKYECRFGTQMVPLLRCEPYATLWVTGVVTPTPDTETPDPPVGVDPTPEQTPDLGDCVPGWSEVLNPWWVFKAQACALKWAFVPKTDLSTRVETIQTSLKTKVPFAWFNGFLAIPAAVPSQGCPDWRVKVRNPGGEGYALDKNVVCDSSYTDAVRAARPVLLVFMGALALWPLVRSTAYAAFPIIKPTPGVLR